MPVIRRSPRDLKSGDHIYVLRNRLGDLFYYYHHGIVVREGDKLSVISFAEAPESHEDERPFDEKRLVKKEKKKCDKGKKSDKWETLTESDVSSDDDDVSLADEVREFAFSVAAKSIGSLFGEAIIVEESIDIYLDGHGEVFMYQYGLPWKRDTSLPDWGTPEEDWNGEKAVDFAKLLLSAPRAFGKYRFDIWNCEHFSSFCRTASLSLEELNLAVRALGDGESLPREYLLSKSKARSIQAEHWIDEGKLVKRPGPRKEDEVYDLAMENDVDVYEIHHQNGHYAH